MPNFAKQRWVRALERVRLVLEGQNKTAEILAASQERVLRSREILERTTPRPKCRPQAGVTIPPSFPADSEHPPTGYLAVLLNAQGILSTQRLLASGDDEAMVLAEAMADGQSVDLWQDARFIEHFAAM